MHEQDSDDRRRRDADDPAFPQPKRPRLVLRPDAVDADWLKPDVRLGADGAIYVRDLSVPGGTRRVESGTTEHDALRIPNGRVSGVNIGGLNISIALPP